MCCKLKAVHLFILFILSCCLVSSTSVSADSLEIVILKNTDELQITNSDTLCRDEFQSFKTASHTSRLKPKMKKKNEEIVLIKRPIPEKPIWFFLLFLFQFLLLAYFKTFGFRNLKNSWKAFLNLNLSQQLYREQESNPSFLSYVQSFNFILSIALFLYLFVGFFLNHGLLYLSFYLLAYWFIIVLGFFFFKFMSYWLLGFIFPLKELSSYFSFNFFLNFKILGVLLIPFIYASYYAVSPYSSYVMYGAIFLCALFVLLIYLKGIYIGFRLLKKYTIHFFLYICTFEILPVIILIKWLSVFEIQ